MTLLAEEMINDDFFIVDDIDLYDESELRRIVAEVESFAGDNKRGLRVTVLNAEQWSAVIDRLLPPRQRKIAALHIHALRDPRDTRHLLVSPSAVQGINEGSQVIYQEIIYALLRCIGSQLEGPLRRGADDIVADFCASRVDINIYSRHYPQEATFVRCIIDVLMKEFGYEIQNWATLLRNDPNKFFTVLRKTRFFPVWMQYIRYKYNDDTIDVLISDICSEELSLDDNLISKTFDALEKYSQG